MSYQEINYENYVRMGSETVDLKEFFEAHNKRRTILNFNELGEVNYFADIGEFLYVVENLDKGMLLANYNQKATGGWSGSAHGRLSSDDAGNGDWAGSSNFEEALDRLRRPGDFYEKEIDEINKATKAYMANDRESIQPIGIDYSVSGLMVDIGKYVTGEPECFMTMDDIEMMGRPHVEIMIGHQKMPSSVPSSDILTYARRVSILYNTLIAMRCNVTVTYVRASNTGATMINVTDGTQRVPLSTFYALMHPATFRRLIFRLIERSRTLSPGYGHGMMNITYPVLDLREVLDNASDREFLVRQLTKMNLYKES